MQHTLVHSTCLHQWPCDLSSFPSYLHRGPVLTSVAWTWRAGECANPRFSALYT